MSIVAGGKMNGPAEPPGDPRLKTYFPLVQNTYDIYAMVIRTNRSVEKINKIQNEFI